MFLILSQVQTEFSVRLKQAAERKGLETLHLTSAEVVRDVALVFHMTEEKVNLILNYNGSSICSSDINGVYCEINAFDSSLWEEFAPEDASYSVQETQALWLAILASLPCPVVNPPAIDTPAGTVLSTPEILYLAHQLGLQIPAVISVESGRIASELLSLGVKGMYADLGDESISEEALNEVDLDLLAKNENHVRIMEELPISRAYVTMIGDQFFASMPDENGTIRAILSRRVPRKVRTLLRLLQKQLNVNLMEYRFSIMSGGNWVFCGCGRPPVFAVEAYGDELFDRIVDFVLKKGVKCGHVGMRNRR